MQGPGESGQAGQEQDVGLPRPQERQEQRAAQQEQGHQEVAPFAQAPSAQADHDGDVDQQVQPAGVGRVPEGQGGGRERGLEQEGPGR